MKRLSIQQNIIRALPDLPSDSTLVLIMINLIIVVSAIYLGWR